MQSRSKRKRDEPILLRPFVHPVLHPRPCYRWILEGAGLEIEDPCDADEAAAAVVTCCGIVQLFQREGVTSTTHVA